jgi:hypothetical protein
MASRRNDLISGRAIGCHTRKDLEPLLFLVDAHFQYMPSMPQFVIRRYAFCFLVIEPCHCCSALLRVHMYST